MVKVLEGNYDNPKTKEEPTRKRQLYMPEGDE
jgi:hypothetical protein